MAIRPFDVRVAAVVRASRAPHDVVLKDYALSYLLAGIHSTPDLAAVMAFKGGTALRKCFFRGYRFSEDLDFTLRDRWEADRVEDALQRAAAAAVELTAPYGRFGFTVEKTNHREEHPFGQIDLRVRVDYPTGASLPIKVEITRDEPILLPLLRLNLIHLFQDEELEAEVFCYSLEEIAMEKLRAFLQARQYLERREWLNRARDLYDLAQLWSQEEFQVGWASLREPLRQKAEARGVDFAGPDDFRDERVLRVYQQQWEPRLRGFVPQLPAFEEARAALDQVLAALFS